MSESPLSCVLLAARHHALSEAVRGLLEKAFEMVVMVADPTSLLEAAERLRPEVAVVDLSLASEHGIAWLTTLRARCGELKVVVLSAGDEPSVRRAVLAAGADAMVLKRELATDLLAAIERLRAPNRQ